MYIVPQKIRDDLTFRGKKMVIKNIKKIIALLLLISFISNISLAFVESAAGGTVTFYGYVRNTSGSPLGGAEVALTIDDNLVPVRRTTTSSGTGYYSVSCSYSEAEPPISFFLTADLDGYERGTYGGATSSASNTHNFALSEEYVPDPSVSWSSPGSSSIVTFTPENTDNTFTFSYSAQDLDSIKLFISPHDETPTTQYGSTYTTMGTSVSASADIGTDIDELHGSVRADLKGYVGSTAVVTSTRYFDFSKQILVQSEMLEEGEIDLGSQLYLIIYDPPGDDSHSTFTEETSVERTNAFSLDVGVGIEVELKASLFNIGTDAKFGVDLGYGFDYEWSNTEIDTLEMSSSINNDDKELVGPGYGDMYWGEREVFLWEIHSTKITYADASVEYTDPILYFGIDYSENILVSHQYAPEAWKQLNPNINTGLYDSVVTWDITNGEFQGGTGYIESSHEEISSSTTSHEFSVGISYETEVKLGLGSTTISASIESSFKHDETQTNSVKTTYYLHDDDSGDYFHYDVGTDARFGVPIFRNTPNANPLLQSKSSTPWEYNTRDYLPPEAGEPVITLDTDGDGYAPSEDDTPLIEIDLSDEAEITSALIVYSDDGGSGWNTASLTERVGEPDSWYGYIPGHEHETTISWYISAQDENDNWIIVNNSDNENFEYTIISRPPEVTLDSPNMGGTFEDSILIEWSGSDLDEDSLTYSLGYQIEGGGWVLIALGLTNNSYIWDISGIADSDAVSLIVYANDGYCATVSDECDFVFSIDNEDIPDIDLTYPLAGFTYDELLTISWEIDDPDDFITGFELYYSVATGEPIWVLIDDTISADILSFDWDTTDIIYSSITRIQIVALNSIAADVDDMTGVFSVDNRPSISVDLIHPNGGEQIEDSCTISWEITKSDESITYEILLEYTTDGETWITIIDELVATSYLWNTRSITPGSNYRVRVTAFGTYEGVALDSVNDISIVAFSINPDLDTPTISDYDDLLLELGDDSQSIIWTITDINPENYTVVCNSETILEELAWSTTEETITITLQDLEIGTFSYTITVFDIWGQSSTNTVIVTVVDTTDPEITLLTPENGSNYNVTQEILYSYDYNDEDNDVTITVYLNSTTVSDSGVIGPLGIGTYILEVVIADSSGNIDTDSITLTVTDDAPIISENSDMTIEYGDNSQSISWILTDLNPKNYTVRRNGITIREETTWTTIEETITIDLLDLAIGIYTYEVIAYDIWEQKSTQITTILIEDSTAPAISFLTPENYAEYNESESVYYTYEYSDEDSIVTIELFLNDTLIADTGVISYLSVGIYFLEIVATDSSGNSASDVISFTIIDPTVETPTPTTPEPTTPTNNTSIPIFVFIVGLVAIALVPTFSMKRHK